MNPKTVALELQLHLPLQFNSLLSGQGPGRGSIARTCVILHTRLEHEEESTNSLEGYLNALLIHALWKRRLAYVAIIALRLWNERLLQALALLPVPKAHFAA